MAVEGIEKYRQLNGEDVLKVILKSNKTFPDGGYFYADASDEELVKNCAWWLKSRKQHYIITSCWTYWGTKTLHFHREKAHNILDYYPDYINHINGVEFDNVNMNLDVVSQQQNNWCKVSKGYSLDKRSFCPEIRLNSQHIRAKCVRTEVEAAQSVYQLEVQYEDYRYDFLKDRRKDLDLLDMERTGKISEEEAVYRHVLRYADNAWFYYRYDLTDYFRDNHIPVPRYSLDSEGYMTHSVTGKRLCPL